MASSKAETFYDPVLIDFSRVGFEPNRNEPKVSCVMPEDHTNRHPLALRVVAEGWIRARSQRADSELRRA